ncbi:hypothetical protein [Myxosarcina sp. GI1]|nr:hypothetical protein [Myxosarcina sp. GI1]
MTVYGNAEDDEIDIELLADFDGNGDLVFAVAGEDFINLAGGNN